MEAAAAKVKGVSSNQPAQVSACASRAGPQSDAPFQDQASAQGSQIAKRALDVILSPILLVLLSPIFAIAALLIKLTDGGPALFWQVRVGRQGREFWCPKFRSMRVGSEHLHDALLQLTEGQGSVTFKLKHDPRMTRIGRLIRTLSIDELPQFWSVFKGDMSLVGPRPPLPREVAQYEPWQRRRLQVKPGLTCIWQVSGRSTVGFAEQVAMDIEYIENRSLWLDLKLISRTIPAVLTRKGAY